METIKLFRKLLFVLSLTLLASGCASITRGSLETLVVNSTPVGADVHVFKTNDEFKTLEVKKNTPVLPDSGKEWAMHGVTPAKFELTRKGEYKVLISKDGYKTAEYAVTNKFTPLGGAGLVGNLIFGGLLGAAIDSSSGALKDLTPNPLEVTLKPETDQGNDQLLSLPIEAEVLE